MQRGQAQEWVDDLVERSRKASESFVEAVRSEVGTQLSHLGANSIEDVAKQVADILKRSASAGRSATSSARGRVAATAATAKKAATRATKRGASAQRRHEEDGEEEGSGKDSRGEEGPGQEGGHQEGPGEESRAEEGAGQEDGSEEEPLNAQRVVSDVH